MLNTLRTSFTASSARAAMLSVEITPALRDEIYDIVKQNKALTISLVDASLVVFARHKDVEGLKDRIEAAIKDGVPSSLDWQITLALGHSHNEKFKKELLKHLITNEELKFNSGKDAARNTILLSIFEKNGEMGKVNKIITEMQARGDKLNMMAYGALIRTYAHKGDINGVVNKLDQMKTEKLWPTYSAFYSGIMKIMVERGNMEDAWKMLQVLHAHGVKPDISDYNILICGCTSNYQTERANEVLGDMLNKGLLPDTVTYTNIIDVYTKTGEMEEANNIAKQMKSHLRLTTTIYSMLINGFILKGEMEKGLEVLEEMIANNMKPTVLILVSFLNGYIRKGEIENGLQIIMDMQNNGYSLPAEIYKKILIESAIRGKIETACKLIVHLNKNQVKIRVGTCNKMLAYFRENTEKEKVEEFVNLLIKIGVFYSNSGSGAPTLMGQEYD